MPTPTQRQNPQPQNLVTFMDVAQDIHRQLQRAATAQNLQLKQELVNNTYPLLMSILEACDVRFQQLEIAVSEIIQQTSSIIQPDLREQIEETLNLAQLVANSHPQGDDQAKALVAKLLDSIEETRAALDDVTVEDGEEDEEGDEGEEDDGGDEEEGDEEEK
jgi:hypothetical protein